MRLRTSKAATPSAILGILNFNALAETSNAATVEALPATSVSLRAGRGKRKRCGVSEEPCGGTHP